MSSHLTCCLLPLGLLAACAVAQPVAEPTPPATPPSVADAPLATRPVPAALAVRAGLRAPLTLRIEGPPATPVPGTRLEVTAHLTRTGRWPGGVELRVLLPVGATLVEGAESTLLDDLGPGEVTRRFVVQLGDAVPADDLKFTALLAGQGFGATAHGAYRFGRPEPRLPSGPRSPVPGVLR